MNKIKKWFWKTAVTPQSYSGGGYTKNVMADAKFMKKLAHKNIKYSGNGYEKLNIKEFISAYTKGKSGLIKAFFCLLLIKKPRYLENGNSIPINNVSDTSNKKNIHHVFPKALLRRNGFDQKEYNNLLNFCFLNKSYLYFLFL